MLRFAWPNVRECKSAMACIFSLYWRGGPGHILAKKFFCRIQTNGFGPAVPPMIMKKHASYDYLHTIIIFLQKFKVFLVKITSVNWPTNIFIKFYMTIIRTRLSNNLPNSSPLTSRATISSNFITAF